MSILRFLKENENTRKVFGKRELKIIEKQLLGVGLTQSEKNRLSRDIRKKFEFIGEICHLKGEFELKKGADIKRMVEEAKEVILEDELAGRMRKIVLFGSFVENKMSFRSDIDISVEFGKISVGEATKFRARISGKVNSRVDVQVYNVLPSKIKKEIDEKGRVLYSK
jgi:predicted nucleotidyltransferase